jgi:hypothetical protein
MDGSVQRTVRWLTLGGGGIVVLYLVSQSPSAVAIGLVLVLAGYICEGLGLGQGQRPGAALPMKDGVEEGLVSGVGL